MVSFLPDRLFLLFWPLLGVLMFLLIMYIGMPVYRYYKKNFPVRRELKMGILSGEIVPWYQPIMNAANGRVSGVEVLARWHHPRLGVLEPGLFIPQAEHTGLIIPMTQRLVEQVRRDVELIKFLMPENFSISININATSEMVAALTEALISFRRDFCYQLRLVVELTERTLVRPDSPVIILLRKLHAEGIDIALDDFGTLFSNLSGIKILPVTIVKIDGSFIRKLNESKDSQCLVESIIELARYNHLSVVAEGVETSFQSEFLISKGVALQQGYYWSRPMPLMDFYNYLMCYKRSNSL